MGWVPPKLMPRPEWMPDEQWFRHVQHELDMMKRMQVRAGQNAKAAMKASLICFAVCILLCLLSLCL